ncbi:MAG: hypothetical protein IJT26_04280 [Bacteroidales bacterium]|nr:hypothetical protein [Bacteroidales bacterium]
MKEIKNLGLVAVSANEAAAVFGGVDKGAQETLYIIGYVIGVIAKVFTSIFSLITRK